MMVISPMDALSFSLRSTTASLAQCDAVWGERHPPHLYFTFNLLFLRPRAVRILELYSPAAGEPFWAVLWGTTPAARVRQLRRVRFSSYLVFSMPHNGVLDARNLFQEWTLIVFSARDSQRQVCLGVLRRRGRLRA